MTSPLELVEQHYRNVSSANIDAEDELFSPDVETIDPRAGTEFSDLFETDGNRITRHRMYYDQVQFMSQLGLIQ
jgi:ketosteroid isomerase-like protein